MFNLDETIAAVATPPGVGGVSIIRVSGPEALEMVSHFIKKDLLVVQSHLAFTAKFSNEDECIDQVMILPMKGPCSFTGEDVVEIHCHGSPVVCQKILKVLCSRGARLAEGGEFTYRAYYYKKIGLVEAQAVSDVIHAASEASVKAAQSHLQGFLTRKIEGFQRVIVDLLSEIEAWVDYPEESLEFLSHEDLLKKAKSTLREMKDLSETFHDGKKQKEGMTVCLVGAPNVGKSSLLNALLREERAIVSEIAGTTRDTIEETFLIDGQHFHVVDTAGIRKSCDEIEAKGIEKTLIKKAEADVELIVLDASRALTNEEKKEFFPLKKHSLLVWNKRDLYNLSLQKVDHPQVVEVSAKTGLGIDQLKKQLLMMAWQGPPPPISECVITCERHFTILNQAISFFSKSLTEISQETSPEFISEDLRSCLKALGQMIGIDVTEEVLSSMFSKFCVGK